MNLSTILQVLTATTRMTCLAIVYIIIKWFMSLRWYFFQNVKNKQSNRCVNMWIRILSQGEVAFSRNIYWILVAIFLNHSQTSLFVTIENDSDGWCEVKTLKDRILHFLLSSIDQLLVHWALCGFGNKIILLWSTWIFLLWLDSPQDQISFNYTMMLRHLPKIARFHASAYA
jgi:hypothetical protein